MVIEGGFSCKTEGPLNFSHVDGSGGGGGTTLFSSQRVGSGKALDLQFSHL